MRISYAITVCTEFLEIQRLINFLLKHKRAQDDIVVLFDEANGDKEIEAYLRSHSVNGEFMWYVGKFDRHFANWKNKLNSYCTGNYIFQIDADEIPTKTLMEYLPDIIDVNPTVDVLLVPRINTVDGLTQEHIAKWGWNVISPGWVNFPDYQWRIFKNKPEIKWKNKVHEVLEGHKMLSTLPAEEEYCLFHPKTIEKQEKQNNYYNTL
jgi:hypothetical protein